MFTRTAGSPPLPYALCNMDTLINILTKINTFIYTTCLLSGALETKDLKGGVVEKRLRTIVLNRTQIASTVDKTKLIKNSALTQDMTTHWRSLQHPRKRPTERPAQTSMSRFFSLTGHYSIYGSFYLL